LLPCAEPVYPGFSRNHAHAGRGHLRQGGRGAGQACRVEAEAPGAQDHQERQQVPRGGQAGDQRAQPAQGARPRRQVVSAATKGCFCVFILLLIEIL